MSEEKIPYQHEDAEESASFGLSNRDLSALVNSMKVGGKVMFGDDAHAVTADLTADSGHALDEPMESTFNPAFVNIERTMLDSTTGHIKLSYNGIWINDLPHRVSLTNGKFDRDDGRWIAVAKKWFLQDGYG